MSLAKKQEALLGKLKKQVRDLRKKEERSRQQLQAAFKKIRHMGKIYKSKLESKMRLMKKKVAEAEATSLEKVARLAERVAKKAEQATKVKKSHRTAVKEAASKVRKKK
jgi:hypothetical protein